MNSTKKTLGALACGLLFAVSQSHASDFTMSTTLYQTNANGSQVYLEVQLQDRYGRTDLVPISINGFSVSSSGSASIAPFSMSAAAYDVTSGGGGGYVDPQGVSPGGSQLMNGEIQSGNIELALAGVTNGRSDDKGGASTDNAIAIGVGIGIAITGTCYVNSLAQNALCNSKCEDYGVKSFDSGICGHNAVCTCNSPPPPPPPTNPGWPYPSPAMHGWMNAPWMMDWGGRYIVSGI